MAAKTLLGTVLLGVVACDRGELPRSETATEARRSLPPFVDVARERGVNFRHFSGRSGKKYIVEIMGSGGGFLDADRDGDLDLLLLNGARFETSSPSAERHRNQFFRNDGSGHFEDATDAAGLGHEGHGMGLAVGDIDADGDPDLLVTNFGADVLYRNRGDGTFADGSEGAAVRDPRWTTSAAFFDYEQDGDLDLYVAAYLDFTFERFRPCHVRGHATFCGPDAYDPLADRLYENDGAGAFADVSDASGIAGHLGKGLGVVAGDFEGDGDTDLFVANDGTANFLFINRLDSGRAGFTEEGVFYGAAYGESATAEAGMGVDMGDFDGDGDPDLVCTNLEAQPNSLYRNDGGVSVLESSFATGLGAASIPWVGFGIRFLDFDLDADLDLWVTNGHIMDNVSILRQGARFAQDDQLFDNQDGRFREIPCSIPRRVGRALASGDIDNDGDLDVLITNLDDAPLLLENRASKRGRSLGLVLEGRAPESNRDAFGARIRWHAFGKRQLREVHAASSYCSSHDPRVLLAVEEHRRGAVVEVRWPSGAEESHDLAVGFYHHLVEGQGVVDRVAFLREQATK